MTDVTLNSATITLIGSLLGPLLLAVGALFALVKGRLTRAENQVDTLIPMARDMVAELKAIREDMARDLRERYQSQREPGGDWPGRRT